jgi:hypothetical protein
MKSTKTWLHLLSCMLQLFQFTRIIIRLCFSIVLILFSFLNYIDRSTIVHSNMIPQKEQSNIASSKNRQTTEEYNTKYMESRSIRGLQIIPLGM